MLKKDVLRAKQRELLKGIGSLVLSDASARLSHNLSGLIASLEKQSLNPQMLLAWVAFFPGEIDLSSFINASLEQGRRVFLPAVISDFMMSFFEIGYGWENCLEPGFRGIPEPKASPKGEFSTKYASETFVKYKTMNIVVNKNSIPKELRKKMGID